MAQKLQDFAWRQRDFRKTGRTRSFRGKRYEMVERGYFRATDGAWLHRDICRAEHGVFPPGWHVHHVNCCPWDNRKKNLVALPEIVHDYVHFLMASMNHAVRVPRKDCAAFARQWKNGSLKLEGRDWASLPLPPCVQFQPSQVERYKARIPHLEERHIRSC